MLINLSDIEEAINASQRAVDLVPDGHANKPAWLNGLGIAHTSRFEHLGDLSDNNKAIVANQKAVDLTPNGHADKPSWLSNLGVALMCRFEHLNEFEYLENAIMVTQQAADLTPDGHAKKPAWFNNLGNALIYQFEHLGKLIDIEKAINLKQKAIDLTPDGHVNKSSWLNNLGKAFLRRFEHLGELTDLEKAISAMKRAIDLTPDDHINKPAWLNNLGKAINANQRAVDLTPDGNTDKPSWLGNLGIALMRQFEHLGQLEDIEKAINVNEKAVDLISDSHIHKSIWLNSLGIAFQSRFEQLGELTDIEKAISANQKAVDLTPDGHAHRVIWLKNLGNAFYSQFDHLRDQYSHDHACSAYQSASLQLSSPPSHQLKAILWASLSSSPVLAMDAYVRIFELIPRVAWLGQTVIHRYQALPAIGWAVNTAVATAISVGNLRQAVEWLEEGRNVVWGQILQLRSPLDDLHQQHPEIAEELEISQALETAGTSMEHSPLNIGLETNRTVEQEAQNHHNMATQYEGLIQKIRACEGFANFLKPKTLSELTVAAAHGPIVIVNVAESRCDALVLSSSEDIIHVPLPAFSQEQADELQLQVLSFLDSKRVRKSRNGERVMYSIRPDPNYKDDFKSVLASLWHNIVQPILTRIESMLCKDLIPHLTWCTTGALAFLPIHAAGIYGSPDTSNDKNISDFVASSYTTTVTAMLNSASNKQGPLMSNPNILIISQPNTPGQAPLPGIEKEVDAIQRCTLPEHISHLSHAAATVDKVVLQMRRYNVVHLACHGLQDPRNPIDSGFALYDKKLKLKDLMKLRLENAELAVLSACQTATGYQNLPEEAIHLAAGMLTIGYSSVIATMWSIQDNDAPFITEKVYASLFGYRDKDVSENESTRLGPAYALHEAVKCLRREVGDTEFHRWVPFIHFGKGAQPWTTSPT
ncbi:hypothetical protein VKT23_006268 [Stygiomarasmius scandens]|uniref:CHAT domain-containing protein n=1 Tax=Marasmiellus scandens TaxID=2682957 RepID=A0ABR1JMC6_9AGAR